MFSKIDLGNLEIQTDILTCENKLCQCPVRRSCPQKRQLASQAGRRVVFRGGDRSGICGSRERARWSRSQLSVLHFRAFSNAVDTGSRQENESGKSWVSVPIQSEREAFLRSKGLTAQVDDRSSEQEIVRRQRHLAVHHDIIAGTERDRAFMRGRIKRGNVQL